MHIFWFIIPVLIIAGIFKFKKEKKKFEANFYEGLTNSQLKNEAIILLNKISNNPLCILNNADFYIVYFSIKDKFVNVLNYS